MPDNLRLLCVFAHPDDESLGNGGMLARYAAEGVETFLVTATLGERGWFGPADEYPGPEQLGRIRQKELDDACRVLGIRTVHHLGYQDGDLQGADAAEVLTRVAGLIREIRPQIVVTFDQFGCYGHPDHMAICQYTTAAVVAAADPDYVPLTQQPPHAVDKLYYMAWTERSLAAYQEAFGELVMHYDGQARHAVPWPEWAITAQVDAGAYWQRAWEAIACHRSQLPGYKTLLELPESFHRELNTHQTYYRAFSRVSSAGEAETDLFAGLR
jgi:LmbE family N-acetylglucosaminyl deacetylase